jgi:DNA-binding PadR family transcriptional regulator
VGAVRRIYEITRAGMEELHRSAKAIAAGHETVAAFLGRYEEFVALSRRGTSGQQPKRKRAQVS